MPSDFELLENWRAGDRNAGSALLGRYFDAVYRFFRNKLDGDVDDLIQRTFLACVESKEKVRDANSFRSYIFSVARNELYRHFERVYRGQKREVDLGSMSVAELGSSPSSRAARRQEASLLMRALTLIPLDLQIAIELHYWDELTAAEIGAVLGVPTGTAKTRLRRARELLEAAMQQIASGTDLATSTMQQFDHWARSLREVIDASRDP